MILRDLIKRIKDHCPIFSGRVYGSAQLEEGIRQAEGIPVPAAFVMVDGDFPVAGTDDPTEVEERWTIVIVVDNKDDQGRGQKASDSLHVVRAQLIKALLGWENWRDEDETEDSFRETDWGPIKYRGSLHIDMNASRLWHQFSFGHLVILSSYQEPEECVILKPAIRGGPKDVAGMHGLTEADFLEVPSGNPVTPPFKPPHKHPTRK